VKVLILARAIFSGTQAPKKGMRAATRTRARPRTRSKLNTSTNACRHHPWPAPNAALSAMEKGEVAEVIVKPGCAYGAAGFKVSGRPAISSSASLRFLLHLVDVLWPHEVLEALAKRSSEARGGTCGDEAGGAAEGCGSCHSNDCDHRHDHSHDHGHRY